MNRTWIELRELRGGGIWGKTPVATKEGTCSGLRSPPGKPPGTSQRHENPGPQWRYNPYAPCIVYLPTFGWCLGPMLVYIPYMERMGNGGELGQSRCVSLEWGYRHKAAPLVGMHSGSDEDAHRHTCMQTYLLTYLLTYLHILAYLRN